MLKRNPLLEIVEIIIICFALSWLLKTYALDFIQVQEKGMYPTVELGDKLVVAKFSYTNPDSLERGDVIAYLGPDNQTIIVKRVVGLPGDKLEIRNGYTYINGQPLYEPYTQIPITVRFEPVSVPKEHVFALNDNRYQQNDSRSDGAIPAEKLRGKAIMRIWPLTEFRFL